MVFIWIGYFLWSLFFALLSMTIASERGGSGTGGFIVGALFGPFGAIVAWWLGDEESRELAQIENGQRKHCPACAELARAQAKICGHCGHDFTALQLRPVDKLA